MRILRAVIEWWRCLFRHTSVESELDEEIVFHLERETARNRAAGMTGDEARRAAQASFGDVDRIKERHRRERRVGWLLDFGQDLRAGVRSLRQQPAVVAPALLALALGIGANTAAFTVLDALLLRPLPLHDPGELVVVWQVREERDDRQKVTPRDVLHWQQQARSFAGLAGIQAPHRMTLIEGEEPEQVLAARATPEFFEVLGVPAARGRVFTAADAARGELDFAVLSHDYWRSRFGADPQIVGHALALNGRAIVVVGVMPESFRIDFPSRVDVWLPHVYSESALDSVNLWSDEVIGRLAPGVTLEAARGELETLSDRLYEDTGREFRAHGVNPVPLHEEIVGATRPALLTLIGAVVMVLLIACVNVAGLLLARNSRRRDELALRVALGAGRTRITRQLFAESLLLAVAGSLLAGGVGIALLRGMLLVAPADLPRIGEVGLDMRVGLFTAVVALTATFLFGTLPAVRGARLGESGGVPDLGRRAVGGGPRRNLARLVALECALVVLLVFAAGSVLQHYFLLARTDRGFDSEGRIAAQVVLPSTRYETPEAIAAFVDQVTERIERLPQVDAVGAAWSVPLSGQAITVGVPPVEGQDAPDPPISTGWDGVTPGFFEATGIRLVSGRSFTVGDDAQAPPVLIVNETLAETVFEGADPVGRFFAVGGNPPAIRFQIVGVVADTVHLGLDQPPRPHIYQPHTQAGFAWYRYEIVVAAGAADVSSLAGEIRRSVSAADPQQPVAAVRTLDELARSSVRSQRFLLVLLCLFGLTALLLGALGIYGVVGYGVAQRRREMGLRLALGAGAGDIGRLVVRAGLAPVVGGLLAGCALAIAAFRVAGAAGVGVGGIPSGSTLLLAPIAALVLLVALAAVAAPARRAMRADPLDSLTTD